MSSCDHNCSTCSQQCDKKDFIIHTNKYSKFRKTFGIVSGKGGVGKSLVTSLLAVDAAKLGYKVSILDLVAITNIRDKCYFDFICS